MEYYIWNYRHKKYALYQNWCLAFWNTLRSKIQIVTYPLNQIWKTYFFHNTKAIGSKHFGLLSDYWTCTFLFLLILNFSPTSRGLLMFPTHAFLFLLYHAVILIWYLSAYELLICRFCECQWLPSLWTRCIIFFFFPFYVSIIKKIIWP